MIVVKQGHTGDVILSQSSTVRKDASTGRELQNQKIKKKDKYKK